MCYIMSPHIRTQTSLCAPFRPMRGRPQMCIDARKVLNLLRCSKCWYVFFLLVFRVCVIDAGKVQNLLRFSKCGYVRVCVCLSVSVSRFVCLYVLMPQLCGCVCVCMHCRAYEEEDTCVCVCIHCVSYEEEDICVCLHAL